MGAWGAGSFENDDAADWLAAFCDEPDKTLIVNALTRVSEMSPDDYLEAPDCCAGIAAAEIVAALKGSPGNDLSEEAKSCMSQLKFAGDQKLTNIALTAMERIRTNSELKELWDESESPDEWYEAMGALVDRLERS